MDYFVVLTPDYDHFWQIELLIESFKLLKMQDDLVIGFIGNTAPSSAINLLQHKRKFTFVDQKYPNKIVGIAAALEKRLLSNTFILLHTDMVIVDTFPDTNCNILFHPHPMPKDIKIDLPKDLNWIGFNGVVKFESVPIKFFQQVALETESLSSHGSNWPIALTAWNLITYKHRDILSLITTHLESNLSSTTLQPIIHYRNGLPPHFSKKTHGMQLTGHPYNALLQTNPNLNTDHMRKVIESYKKAPA